MSQKISAIALAEQRAIIKRQRKVSAVSKGNSVSAPWTRGQVAPKRSAPGSRAHYAHATGHQETLTAAGFAVKGRIAAGIQVYGVNAPSIESLVWWAFAYGEIWR